MEDVIVDYECILVQNEGLVVVQEAADGTIYISLQYLAWPEAFDTESPFAGTFQTARVP